MKFGKTLHRNQIPEWGRHYLSYKGLKKEIKNGQDARDGESSKEDVVTGISKNEHKKFISDAAREEVEKISNFFIYKRSELERRLRILSEKSRRLNPASSVAMAASTPTIATAATTLVGFKPRPDLSIVTPLAGATGNTPLVPQSPFISDPEAEAECLQAMVDTKEMLSKLSWFAEMNRRAVEKILKKFDKCIMATASREGYMNTKVNQLPFVIDGQLSEMTLTIDVLIREMRAVVADHPPFKSGVAKHTNAESRLGLTEEQIDEAMMAIGRDDVTTLQGIIDSNFQENPGLEGILFASIQSGRILPRTLFRKACEVKAYRCIVLIMSFGSRTLILNVNEQTVLHRLAIEGGSFTKAIDNDHINTNSQLNSGAPTQSQQPAQRDDPELIVFILKQLSSYAEQDSLCTPKSTADIFGRRPLHYAAMHDYPNITGALINDLKASGEFIDFSDPYWFDTDGFTPLIYAVSRGHAGVVKVLVEEGGIKDVDAVTNAYATYPSLPKIMPSIPKTVLNPLVGSEVNLHAVYTYTPLSIACRLGHVEVAKLLIHFGADLNAQDEDGESCLLIAAKNGHLECVNLLIAGAGNGVGANLELREGYYGWTALHLAAIENHPEVVRVLLAAGANPNVYDYSSWNPHEHAIFAANNVCAALLRPVTRTLDERLRLQKLSTEASDPSLSRPISPNTLAGVSDSQSPRPQKLDSPPVSNGKNNARLSKTTQRAYGHKYLEDASLIVVTLGSNDVRSTVEPVELYITGDTNSFLTASTAFSLEITADNATAGEKVIVDLPLKDSSYHEQI
ncbi:Glycerophosphocholine phosphodiesterase, partial [Modicella reniformis]